jgi:hypothetical protein
VVDVNFDDGRTKKPRTQARGFFMAGRFMAGRSLDHLGGDAERRCCLRQAFV